MIPSSQNSLDRRDSSERRDLSDKKESSDKRNLSERMSANKDFKQQAMNKVMNIRGMNLAESNDRTSEELLIDASD